MQISEGVVIAVIGAVPAIVGLILQNIRLSKKYRLLKRENDNHHNSGIQAELEVFNEMRDIIDTIFHNTKADRFLILTALNGKTDFRFATAVYEQHNNTQKTLLSVGATSKYVKFEFDDKYKNMLKQAEREGMIMLETSKMDPSDLKSIYLSEKVSFANIYFLLRKKIDDKNDRIFYCSVASHSGEPFTDAENVLFKARVGQIKLLVDGI